MSPFRRRVAASVALWLALGHPPHAYAQFNLLHGSSAPYIPTTSRAPLVSDNGYKVGALWGFGGRVWEMDASYTTAAGVIQAEWTDVTNPALPLDVIGLQVATATPTSTVGTGYAVGSVLTFGSGTVLTVASITPTTTGGTTGTPLTFTITSPGWNGCSSTAAQTAVLTTGGGTGATTTFTFNSPSGWSLRKISSCYTGNLASVGKRNGVPGTTLAALPSGEANYAPVDQIMLSTNPSVLIAYDQGGAFNMAAPAYNSAPTYQPFRAEGGNRSIMFDSLTAGGAGASGGPTTTYLTNATETAPNTADTFIWSGGIEDTNGSPTANYPVGVMLQGGTAANAQAIVDSVTTNTLQMVLTGSTVLDSGMPAWDKGNLVIGSNNGTASSLYVNGTTVNATNTLTAATLTAGYLGVSSASSSGNEDTNVAIMVPWALTAAQKLAVEISIVKTFGLQPQGPFLLLAAGDSRLSGWATTFQQNLPRQLQALWNRPDIHVSTIARPSEDIATTTSRLTTLLPVFQASLPTGGALEVLQESERSTSTLTSSNTAADVYVYRKALAAAVHAAGSKVACLDEPMLNETVTGLTVLQFDAILQNLNGLIKAGVGTDCDTLGSLSALTVYNTPGSFPVGPYGTDGIHQQTNAVGQEAAIALPAVNALFPH